jgi:exodeoxyribonuclease VII large subunit
MTASTLPPDDSASIAVIPVGELNARVRRALECEFPLQWVAGEVSNLTRAASGHVYFTLKDEAAQARCVMFRSRAQSLPWRLENGQQVEVRALVSLYEARGDFQLNVEQMRRAGLGRLYEAFARLKDKLAGEGLFAAEAKQPIPRFPRRIGIVSSPQAAAVRDVLVALRRRAPHLPCVLYPTLVQGERAAEGIAQALALANARAECDVLLLIRGGGSIEDLWAFNEEVVARAIAASTVPVMSGVGHETDTTIADFVADLRAATPTAAAELVSQAWYEAHDTLAGLRESLQGAMQYRITNAQQRLDHLVLRLVHPATRLQRNRDRLAYLAARLASTYSGGMQRHRSRLNRLTLQLNRSAPRCETHRGSLRLLSQCLNGSMTATLGAHKQHLQQLSSALNHLNPQATLERGFSIVRTSRGAIVTSASALNPEDAITIDMAHGQIGARVTEIVPTPTIAIPDKPD